MAELDGRPADPAELAALALTNYGHFTTMRVDSGRVRGLALHLDRLVRDCRTLFDADLDRARLARYVRRVVPVDGTVIVRVTVYDPALDLGRIGDEAHPHVLVTTRPAGPLPLPPIRVRSVSYLRELPEVKSTALLGALYQRRAALRAGYDDALFTAPDGAVLEGGTWNIGLVRGTEIHWPQGPQLPGVAMRLLRRAHPGVTVRLALAELPSYDAAFATNAVWGIRPIGAVDEHPLAPAHPLIEELRRWYQGISGDAV